MLKSLRTFSAGLGIERIDQGLVLILAASLFYAQDVKPGWLLVALLLSVIRIGITLAKRRPVGEVTPFLWVLFAINVVLGVTTAIQGPGYWEEYLRQFLVPALLAIAIPLTFDDRRAVLRLVEAIGIGLLVLIVVNLAQYWHELQTLGAIPDDIRVHRHYGDGLIVTMPMVLMLVITRSGRWLRIGGVFAILVGAAMLIMTGMRGAWLSLVIALLVTTVLARRVIDRRWVFGGIGAILAVFVAVAVLAPPSFTTDRIRKGFSTSHRVHGTWEPALNMIAERPIVGYGWGEREFHARFNAHRPQHPEWSLKKSEGPHNSYLSLGFAGGVPVMLTYIAMLWGVIVIALRRAAGLLADGDAGDNDHALLGLSILTALIASYGLHGLVETKAWPAFGIVFGALLAWLRATSTRRAEGD